jgi:hypothetical protein
MAVLSSKAAITKGPSRKVACNTGRGTMIVICPCGRRNRFDSFSWAGHGACRCRGCKMLIATDGTVADSRQELRDVRPV